MAERRGFRLLATAVLGAAALAVVAVLATAGVALWQLRDERPETATLDVPLSTPGGGTERVSLVVEMAELVVVPAPEGEDLRLESSSDPRRQVLARDVQQRSDGTAVQAVRFVPAGSRMLALARAKLGGPLPRLRVSLPRGRRLRVTAWLEGGVAALELGGLDLESVELHAHGAALDVGFAEPLARPLDALVVSGELGRVSVRDVGTASPASVVIEQRVGALDVDLRGTWARDADVSLAVDMAGGTAWLPAGVAVERDGATLRMNAAPGEPGGPPRVRLAVSERRGRLVLVDPGAPAP